MSTDVSQVHFYHLTFLGFPFVLIFANKYIFIMFEVKTGRNITWELRKKGTVTNFIQKCHMTNCNRTSWLLPVDIAGD